MKILKVLSTIGKGIVKPTPLSGVVGEFKKAKQEKDWLKFTAYTLMGLAMLYLLYKGALTVDQLKDLLKIIF